MQSKLLRRQTKYLAHVEINQYSYTMIRLVHDTQSYSLVLFDGKSLTKNPSNDCTKLTIEIDGRLYLLGAEEEGAEGNFCWGLLRLASANSDNTAAIRQLPKALGNSLAVLILGEVDHKPVLLFKFEDQLKLTTALMRLGFQIGSQYYWAKIDRM